VVLIKAKMAKEQDLIAVGDLDDMHRGCETSETDGDLDTIPLEYLGP